MLLGDIIKNYRKEHKMSLQDFANLIHTSRSYIHMLEKNFNPATGKPISPSIETLRSISNAMNITIEDLIKLLDSDQYIYLNEYEYQSQFKNEDLNHIMINCGYRLRKCREQHGYTIDDIAKRTGTNKNKIERWETGNTSDIGSNVLTILADLYDVNEVWLMGYDVSMERELKEEQNNDFKFASYNGVDTKDLDDEDIEEINRFVEFIRNKKKNEKNK